LNAPFKALSPSSLISSSPSPFSLHLFDKAERKKRERRKTKKKKKKGVTFGPPFWLRNIDRNPFRHGRGVCLFSMAPSFPITKAEKH